MEEEIFTTAVKYDALNRPIKRVTPNNSIIHFIYNAANLLEQVESKVHGADTITPIVIEIKYNARGQREFIAYGNDIQLKLDKKNYFISGKSLYDQYVESGIISKDGYFSPNLYKDIANEFFRYAKKIPIKPERNMILPFFLFVLPTRSPIDIAAKSKETSQQFTDSFGNSVTSYASGTTKNAKFLSFDDKAFTINCKKEEDFYENIGLGAESLQRISLPADQIFKIAGRGVRGCDL